MICQPDAMCTLPDISDESGSFTAHANHLVVGPGSFPGDSGSGIVAQSTISQPTPVVLAVTSLGTWAAPDQPNGTLGVHVSKHAELIKSAAQQAATAGGYPLPDWASGKLPDDGTGSGSGSANDDDDDEGGCSSAPSPSLLVVLLLTVRPLRRRASAACCAAAAR